MAAPISLPRFAPDQPQLEPIRRPLLVPAPLPEARTSLIGREHEIARIRTLLLDQGRRLITLTGPGGVGKSRLALRVATGLTDHLDGGCWFVPLNDLGDPNLLIGTIARALGLNPGEFGRHGPCPVEPLVEALQHLQILLVLDGFERLVEAAPQLSVLLLRCPGLRLLVTSRVRLRLNGEQEVPVPPLSVGLPASDAVRLFVERAEAVRPDLDFAGRDGQIAVEICRRLDGLPLAIELAAARLSHLAPADLLDRLEARLPLLNRGARDAPARHRTMRDAIAWSVDLLEPPERLLFARLGVFTGSFTLEAAEFVGGGAVGRWGGEAETDSSPPPHRPTASVLDGLAALVDASLVRLLPVDPVTGEARYGMLDTVREQAAEALAGLPEAEAEEVRGRLAAWLIDLNARAFPQMVTAEREVWLGRLAAEEPNLLAALAWAIGRRDAETALRLIVGAAWYRWDTKGMLATHAVWLERALALAEQAPERVDPVVFGRGLTSDGMGRIHTGDFAGAQGRYEAAIEVLRRAGEAHHLATALSNLANALSSQGRYEEARERHAEVIALRRRVESPARLVVHPQVMLGATTTNLGRLEQGRAELEEALGAADRHGDGRDRAFVRAYLGHNLLMSDRIEEAIALLTDAVARLRELQDVRGVSAGLTWLALAERRRGRAGRAAALLAEALPLVERVGDRPVAAPLLDVLAGLLLDGDQAEAAARLLGAAHALRSAMGTPLRPCDRPWREAIVAGARAALGLGRFARAEMAGAALGLAEALAEARTLLEQHAFADAPPPPPANADVDPELRAAIGALSPRELEVLQLVVEGLTDREIGGRLSISQHTVSNHVARILSKLQVPTRAAATAIAIRAGLA
jgi:predicted ATPase/DNA-binding CsgD family transcriptional regulator